MKSVPELPQQRCAGIAAAIDWNLGALRKIETSKVIDAENMIGVCVRKQDGVNSREARAQRLAPKVRWCVHENPYFRLVARCRRRRVEADFDGDGGPHSIVLRIAGSTDAAAAARDWYSG